MCLALTPLSVLGLGTQASNSQPIRCFENPQYEEMVQLTQDGLGQMAERKQIVVIRAGMAGLTVAKTLQDAGHQVYVGKDLGGSCMGNLGQREVDGLRELGQGTGSRA